MADNYKNNNFNNNKDDIDEFFAKFDQPSAPQQGRPSNPAGNRKSSSPAPRRSQPQRPQGQRVQGQRPQSQRPQGQRTTVHRNQGNGLELQDLLQIRTATMHSHPVRLQPT